MPTEPMSDRARKARHEAAHAVVGIRFGLRPDHLSLDRVAWPPTYDVTSMAIATWVGVWIDPDNSAGDLRLLKGLVSNGDIEVDELLEASADAAIWGAASWPDIERLAAVLEERGELTGAEALAIVEGGS